MERTLAMKETKKGQSENRKKIKILPFHGEFEWRKWTTASDASKWSKKARNGKRKARS